MADVIFNKAVTGGEIRLPSSKSVAHRAIICASLAKGKSVIYGIDESEDMKATFGFINAVGKKYTYDTTGDYSVLTIEDNDMKNTTSQIEVDCIESGSTLRFIIPILSALGVSAKFVGSGRLPQRPIGVYNEILTGVTTHGDGLPFTIDGKLQSGDFRIRGDISSQFITGLLFALPLLDGDSKIILTTELQSESYVDITVDVLKTFGIAIERTDYGYFVNGNQAYKNMEYHVEGDWSHAIFFMVMATFSDEPIRLKGLNMNSKQGDKKCVDLFKEMGLNIKCEDDVLVLAKPVTSLKAISVDVGDIPDMVPALTCAMATAEGKSEITNAKRLRIKECDRLSAISNNVNALGGNVEEFDDALHITGVKTLNGGTVSGYNDHRIVMAMSTLRAKCENDISVSDSHSINKSYPKFYEDYKKLGGDCNVVNMG